MMSRGELTQGIFLFVFVLVYFLHMGLGLHKTKLLIHMHIGAGGMVRAVLMINVCLPCRFTTCLSFYSILNELNDYAGQREVVAEEMAHKVYGELMRYSQDLKAERKHVSTHKFTSTLHINEIKRHTMFVFSASIVYSGHISLKTTCSSPGVAVCVFSVLLL